MVHKFKRNDINDITLLVKNWFSNFNIFDAIYLKYDENFAYVSFLRLNYWKDDDPKSETFKLEGEADNVHLVLTKRINLKDENQHLDSLNIKPLIDDTDFSTDAENNCKDIENVKDVIRKNILEIQKSYNELQNLL